MNLFNGHIPQQGLDILKQIHILTLMLRKLYNSIAELEKVLAWVGPIVNGRHDQWKADRLKEVIALGKEIVLHSEEDERRQWYVPMTDKQGAKLVERLLGGEFRFYLKLSVETVTYDKGYVSVLLHKGTMKPRQRWNEIGSFINGYYAATRA